MIVQGHQQVSDMMKRGERVIAAEGARLLRRRRPQGRPRHRHDLSDRGRLRDSVADRDRQGLAQPERGESLCRVHDRDTVQKMFPEDGGYAARVDIAPPPGSPALGDLKLMPVDYDYIEKDTGKIKARFNEIFQ